MKTKKVRFYIGLDVHKEFTVYAVRDINGNIVLEGRCASIGKDLYDILEPYLFSCVVGLETNTEIYPVYDYFKEKSIDIRAGNTIQLRTLIGKNDRLDAKRLSDMLRLNTFPCAFIPEGKIKKLRGLVRTRHNTMKEVKRFKSQIQALTRMHGMTMPTGETFTKKYCDSIQECITLNKGGVELRHLYDMYEFMNAKLEQLTTQMNIFAKINFPKEYEAVIAQRGIGETLTPYFISEICPISRFKSEKSLRRYAGVIPVNNETADKVYSTYLPKASSRALLRYALVDGANCVSKHDEQFKMYFRKKKKQKKLHQKAIMAVARSLSDKIYKTLKACQAS